jgi:hypothetical protein
MATTHTWYTLAKKSLGQKLIDWEDDTIKVSLHTSTHTPDLDAHDFQDDLTNEVTATGYTAGGGTITTPTLTGGTGTLTYDGVNVSWTITGSLTFQYAVIYDSTPGSTATNPLISLIDFGTDQTITDGTLTLNFNASGILLDTIS